MVCTGFFNYTNKEYFSPLRKSNRGILLLRRISYMAVFFVFLLIVAFILFPTIYNYLHENEADICKEYTHQYINDEFCSFLLVESIPLNLTYSVPITSVSTFDAWKALILNSTKSIEIASFYWSLRGAEVYQDPSDWLGEEIFKLLLDAVKIRKLKVTIVENQPNGIDNETLLLKQFGASVKSINFTKMIGNGVLHTKLWIFDRTSFYVGSANMDWRSLSQVKELGLVATNCPTITYDIQKIFEVYNYLGDNDSKLPLWWPISWRTFHNIHHPFHLNINNVSSDIYIASAPPALNPIGRTSDVDAIIHVISTAKIFIYIAVMDYSPSIEFAFPRIYWPIIDDALRRASIERGVHVSLLMSWWKHTKPDMINYLKSLSALNGIRKHTNISIKLFCVPAFTKNQSLIPFARVNHNKYMVTESTAYIGTSNWSGDYFTSTAGIGFVINQTSSSNSSIQNQLQNIFERDFQSVYAVNLKDIHKGYTCDKFK